jgi:hypothetical protein
MAEQGTPINGKRSLSSRAFQKVWRTIHQEYQHEPLPSANEFTRILFLQPAKNPDDELVCSLQVTQYREAECPFEAISYTRGAPVFPEVLNCEVDGSYRYLRITQNLSDTLRIIFDVKTRLELYG